MYNPTLRIRITHYVAIAVLIVNALVFTDNTISITVQLILAVIVYIHHIDDKILNKTILENSSKLEDQAVVLQKSFEEAKSATEAKSLFLANMSHEIRTPLNGIIGFLNILESTPLNREQKKHLKVIENSSHILLHVINDILDFSKIEANKIDLERISIDPYHDIIPSFEMFKMKASEKNITFDISIEQNIPCFYGDLLRLKQILINLLNNAIKFTHKGKVTLSITLLEETQTDIALSFAVSDTGIGIAKEKQYLIFEDFQQSDSSISREFDGTGLGLSITKKLLVLFGSFLKLESESGKGSVFSFVLRSEISKEQKVEQANTSVQYDFSNLRVLIAEDNAVNQILLKYILEEANITCTFTENGEEVVLEYTNNHKHYDIILMDINMPKLDGVNATLQIKEYETKNDLEHIPIVALTANTLSKDIVMFKEIGMADYLSKPIDKNLLFNILQEHSDQN